MESIGYILIYFLKGVLPWQGLAGKTKDEKYDRIKERKMQTTVETLTRGVPEELSRYLEYCKGLQFEEKPDYSYLKGLFRSLMAARGYEYDGRWDWVLKKEGRDDELKQLLTRQPENQQAQFRSGNEETKE